MRAAALVLLAAAGCGSSASGPPNIILVSMDTTRADHMTMYGHTPDTTPYLAMLAERGVVFEESFSQANESAYSHGALLTGRYASELAAPVYTEYAIPDSALFVSEILQLYGYETGAFLAGGHVSEGFGFNQGWDTFSAEMGFAFFWHTVPKALGWLDEREHKEKPYFLMVHGYDAHRPYVVPPPFFHMFTDGMGSDLAEKLVRDGSSSEQVYDRVYYPDARLNWFKHSSGKLVLEPRSYDNLRFAGKSLYEGLPVTQEDVDHIQAHYDAMLAYADFQLGMFFAAAERAGYLDNTVIIITGDHGEDLLDHEFMNHRTSLHDANIKVPLIIVGPGFPEGKRVHDLVDALDVVPPILEIAGAKPPAGLTGRSLREVANGEARERPEIYIEGVMDMVAVRTQTHKLIYKHQKLDDPTYVEDLLAAPFNPQRFELNDLVADPKEMTNLLDDPTPETLAVAEELRQHLAEWRKPIHTGEHFAPEMTDEQRRIMQEHGYWDMGGDARGEGEAGQPGGGGAP